MLNLKFFRAWFEKFRSAASHSRQGRFIGGPTSPFSNRIPLDEIAVTRQSYDNTCVPASLDMLLEHHSPGRASTTLSFCHLRPTGLSTADAIGFIDSNFEPTGLRLVRGNLVQAIESGQPFIAFVVEGDEGHAVLVQGVREVAGLPYLIVRDPARGAYLERLTDFDARLVRDQSVVGHPTVWGER